LNFNFKNPKFFFFIFFIFFFFAFSILQEGHGDSTYSTVPFIQLDQQTVIIGDGGRILPSAPPTMKIELTYSGPDNCWKVRDLSPNHSLIVDNQVSKEALVSEGDVLSFGPTKKGVGSYAKPTSGTTYVLLWGI
jgi:hypothetical protein